MASAVRPRANGGRFICRVRSTGFLRRGFISGIVTTTPRVSRRTTQDDRSRAQAAVVGDHAEAGDQADLRALDGARAGVVGELADRLGHAEEAAGAAGLAGRELAAAGVVREVAVVGQRSRANERRAFALGAETEVLELKHDDDRIV